MWQSYVPCEGARTLAAAEKQVRDFTSPTPDLLVVFGIDWLKMLSV